MRRPPLAEHQASGIQWIQRVQRGLLGDEPGLGKSRVAIEAFDGGRVLVVAPAMVIAGETWSDELALWADHPEGFTVVPYSMLNARNGNTPNFGTKQHPRYKLRPEYAGPWDTLVVDEAHYTKGRDTSWTWAVEAISKSAGAVLEMTGTPVPNWPHEIYTILRVLNPQEAKRGARLGSYWRWIGQWFEIINPTEKLNPHLYNPNAKAAGDLKACYPECLDRPAYDPCEHYHRFVQENLGDRFLQRLRDEVLKDLPPATEQIIHTPMDVLAKRYYRELKKDFVTSVNGTEVVAWTPGSKNVLLDRVTTSAWFLDREGEPRGGKLDRLEFDLSSRARPTLVLAHYRDSVEACARVAERTGARVGYVHGGQTDSVNGKAVSGFKRGHLDVLVGSLEKISEGLTLTVADMAIFVEKSYKPSRNQQAMRRIHRMGQTRPVTILDYVTPKSVDENKRALLAVKTDRTMRMLTAAQFAALV